MDWLCCTPCVQRVQRHAQPTHNGSSAQRIYLHVLPKTKLFV